MSAAGSAKAWLVVPYERTPGDEGCCRTGLAAAVASGLLDTVAYSACQPHFLGGGDAEGAKRVLLDDLRRHRPGVVLWQTPKQFPIDAGLIAAMRASHRFCLVYQDNDVWDRWAKRPTRAMRVLARHADAVVLTALGPLRLLFERLGARQVLHAPHSFDDARFTVAPPAPAEEARTFDAVMIGNLVRRRWPLPQLPGMRERLRLATLLREALGGRLAIHGRGWDPAHGSSGPLPYERQTEANRSAWLSVNWDHYADYPSYYSDRLPIALASGSVHVCSYHPGYETMLAGCPGVHWGSSPEELVGIVRGLLRLPRQDLVEQGAAAQRFASERLSATAVYRALVRDILALHG